ncbi:Alpha/Beta hydrolase protein [Phaeosphaeria sp. MPI-PUGE-AT-0046c]|nr:Alpha/Beta hydrolase protein [Phaeosphaeria sp. MPI-PUGE-AT-0046c]
MASQEPVTGGSVLELFHKRLSPAPSSDDTVASKAPIVFLHGLETCHIEFSRVTPFLEKDYELILVDLPGHSNSKDILTLTMENAANAVSQLISTKVSGGKAHVVGMSLGGYVGLELAQRYPGQVLSLFCTGCAPDSGFRKVIMSQARLLAGFGVLSNKIVSDQLFWAPIGVKPLPALREEMRKNQSMALLTAGYTAVQTVTLEDLAKINGVRIAIVAGAKRDSVGDAKEAGVVLSRKNQNCKAFVVREAVHLWDLQLPELFAQGVRAWIESSKMPEEFEVL